MNNARIVLLNPPGDKPYLRDYFCSTISKGRYYWPPIDLLIQAGILREFSNIKVIDAIAEKMTSDRCEKLINDFSPHAILFLTGTISFHLDKLFLKRIKKEISAVKIIGIGEIFLDTEEKFFHNNNWLDGALLSFIGKDMLYFMDGKYDAIKNMYFKVENTIHKRQNFQTRGEYKIPIPPHELFPLKKYHIPHSRYHPFASILTNYGCPYACYFCNSGSLGFRQRNLENIMEELEYIHSLRIKEVFFKDMTFGVNKKQTLHLLKAMYESGLSFSWNCYSRIDLMDEDIVSSMKRCGCHLIQFGIESLNSDLMKKYGKGYTHKDILDCFALLKKYNIDVGLHFILGLPGETKDGIMDIINFARGIDCKYASFNIASPRYGSKMRKDILETDEELSYFFHLASRQFYLNPLFILKQLAGIRSVYEFKNLVYNGFKIMKDIILL